MSDLSGATIAIVAGVMALYVLVLLGIGWSASRRTHGGEDFHLAGRSLGAWAAGISSTASSESGWVTLGAVGMTYMYGVSGLWYAPGCLLGYVVNLYFVAPHVRRLSRRQGSLTLTDVIARSWGDPRNILRVVSVVIILVSMLGYVTAQMTAAGKAFASTFGLDTRAGYVVGVLLGALIITAVTSLGGFRGVAWTDLFQGLLMVVALIGVPVLAIWHLGGLDALARGLGAIDPDLLTATGGRVESAAWGFIVGELGIGLGYPGMPHVITRYMATRDPRQLRRLRLIGIMWGVGVFYGAGAVGLAARVMFPELADPERALMHVALALLPAVLAGLVLSAVLSAILSTVSSQLLVAASAVSYDVVEGVLGRHSDERRSLLLGRWTVVAVGVVGVLLALTEVRVVFWFVLFAWSIMGAAFGPLILMSGRPRLLNRHGALAGMLVGAGVSVAWKLGRGIDESRAAFDLVPWGAAAATALLLGLLAATRRLGRGEATAIAVGFAATVGAWAVVPLGQLRQVYELPPAFVAAGLCALVVARVTR